MHDTKEATDVMVDGNEAAAMVAYRLAEVIALYPITPSSPMGESCDEWAAKGDPNLWGQVPRVVEAQSEAGAAGMLHGAIQTGALATTFTASQGLLLMIPDLYKIAGELSAAVFHVAARTVATHALSIFGDHSDVMACRQTGAALLASGSVQEAHDLAAVAHAAALDARLPFLHFFDGFRTSHEVDKIRLLSDADLRAIVSPAAIAAHRERALNPDRPMIRGTSQNPDTFFQAREAQNRFYAACPDAVEGAMDRLFARAGRRYHAFDYAGHPEAERVIVAMGSGAETAHSVVEWLVSRGEKVGVVKVRLYRPFDAKRLLAALPRTARAVAVLDRTKEPGAPGEPLFLDVTAAVREAEAGGGMPGPRVVGGRYGLGGKELTPGMIRAVFDELAERAPRPRFTLGVNDDVTHLSLRAKPLDIESGDVVRALFYGLGSDGTVGANKSSIKILGEDAGRFAQGYFVYDSKKSGTLTVSHLRFGPKPIRAPYLITSASFVACHHFSLLSHLDVLEAAGDGAMFLLNAPYPPEALWEALPPHVRVQILDKRLRLFAVDATRVAREAGLPGRTNTVLQTCFFALSGVLPREEAVAKIKRSIEKTYARKGPEVVARNFAAVDRALDGLREVAPGPRPSAPPAVWQPIPPSAPEFLRHVTAALLRNEGEALPVSAFPVDGTWPVGTTRFEKRTLAEEIPVWEPDICPQCNKCALACPHAAIRPKVYPKGAGAEAPGGFKQLPYRGADFAGMMYALQVAPEDCTGCGLCVEVCPATDPKDKARKAIHMAPLQPIAEAEKENWAFFTGLPSADRTKAKHDPKGSQLLEPLFEFSGACSGCGETPYVKLLTQLFGDRLLVANATGCSSIYGGNLPTTPYCTNEDGRGPAWSNSLFEDNAEFGFGMRLGVAARLAASRQALREGASVLGETLVTALLESPQGGEAEIAAQRERVAILRQKLEAAKPDAPWARLLAQSAGDLVRRSVWIVGGDGWAYDIGYGGLDHVIAQGEDVNLLVLDTEVYSNTGGQQSKATPLSAIARFAAAGKATRKKDLGLMAMSYGNVYVARVAFGAKDAQTVKAIAEAESYRGTSLVIAYSPCIAHGYDLAFGADQQRLAVASGAWLLYRYDPRRTAEGKAPLQLDCAEPKTDVTEFFARETRFAVPGDPKRHEALVEAARIEIRERWALHKHLASFAPFAKSAKG